MTLQIFPYALVRYASMPFRELDTLHMPGISTHITATSQLNAQLQQQRDALCDQLFTTVQAAEDHKERQRLLQLKRNIYNGKIPAGATAMWIAQDKDPALHAALQAYLQLHEEQQSLLRAWEKSFKQHIIRSRRQLQAWAQQELLRSGILLSSPVLYGQLDGFAAADPAAFRNRELKNEYSLLRYITRMAGKTSPFSTFTYTGTATLRPELTGFQQPAVHAGIDSHIRLNNGLFAYIRSLMIHHPVLNEILEVKLNVTAVKEEEQLCFLVNYFNVEAFQRMPARNLPLWLFGFLQEHGTLASGALTDILAQHIPDTDRESIKAFLQKLSASGFLEPGIGCSGVDPGWDAALARFLMPHIRQYPAAAALHRLLELLAEWKGIYAGADVMQRRRLLDETAATLNKMLCALQEEAGLPVITATPDTATVTAAAGAASSTSAFEVDRFAPRYFMSQDIFYEDACTQESGKLPAAAVQLFLQKADKLCTLLEPMDTLQEERQRMRHFFLQHFDAAHTMPVTAFYHAYYLHEKKQAAAQQGKGNPLLEPMPIPDTMQLKLHPSLIDISAQAAASAARGIARGLFVQFYNEPQNGEPVLHGVVNALLPGMGKVAGRFLHLFDPAVADAFLEWNTSLQPDCMMMELNDGSTFNANIHPPLLPYEICMPGGNNNYPVNRQVSLRDVTVQYNSDTDLLSLYHAGERKEIFAYDLCLESFYSRSHFYRLLAHFNPEPRLPLRRLIAAVDLQHAAAFTPQDDVQLKPRIVFEKQVVIRRKGWLVKTAAVPEQQQGETDAAYFLRLQGWRERHGLPEHVFLFLKSPYIKAQPGAQSRLQRDDYKPQYICFTQPLLVILLKKLLGRAGAYCYLEEMLPHAAHLQQHGPASTVTEYMLHWYKC
ncbi:lantibiotic dehydratase [Chitinophaga japonensis]|uniref:Lantibiotic biosynthesis dehydratase-like protein n=1 Tax=Chitinophaga japonensis TaxID=104662 RepID=A0A562ST41_CHIJA|nr:lantibiotic dehydratase [Chitinophaga japonensis]TWI84194.1 lantibiotic biosynthesis dehydratase-like protein [Chitinophaga japonensis]